MTFDLALRLTEILMGLAIFQQSCEHLSLPTRHKYIFIIRGVLCLALVMGFTTNITLWGLLGTSLVILHIYQAPFNGGSDRLSLLMQFCLCMVTIMPSQQWAELPFAYLGAQVVLSYFISGWVKIKNPEWRSGQALTDVFAFSTYPVAENVRKLSKNSRLVLYASWGVILLELAFPFAFASPVILAIALICTALFHLANACLFGLNRFFWIWISTYPCLFWLQDRLIS